MVGKKRRLKKGRREHPPQEKTIGVLWMLRFLSYGPLALRRIANLLAVSNRAIYRYKAAMEAAGLHFFVTPHTGNEKSQQIYSLWPGQREIMRVKILFSDETQEDYAAEDFLILPVKKWSKEEIAGIKKAEKQKRKE